jgi:hypothetical protein
MAKTCSEQTRILRSEAAKRRWANPVFKAMVSKKLRKRVSSPCLCGCGEMTALGKKYRVGHNFRVNHPMLGKKHSLETIKKMVSNHVYLSGEDHPMFGKTHTPDARRRLSESHKGIKQSPELIKKRVDGRRGYRHSSETLRKIGDGNKGKVMSPEARRKCSEANKGKRYSPKTEFTSEKMKALHRDPIYMDKIWKALNIKPNKPETVILNLLNSLYPDEWKYTGDFSFTINGKSPDFVNCNGQKKIIELFGDYWHRGQNPQDRIDAFKPFGYDTLVIWERELKDMDLVTNKIREFSEAA